jgi:hypothetical protein
MNGAVALGAEAVAAVAVLRGFVPRTGGGRGVGSAEPELVTAGTSASLPSID